jgi:phage repressor protein C with HTH and peptisase S24 domain
VSEKAKAGYRTGFADPEYVSILPTFSLPFLSKQKKYRSFEISGDSMLPIPDGSLITGEFVQNWQGIRSGLPYVVLTIDDGIVFKIVENDIKTNGKLRLISLNPLYEPYEIHINQVREIWKFVNYISSQVPAANSLREKIEDTVIQLQKQVKAIQMKLELE